MRLILIDTKRGICGVENLSILAPHIQMTCGVAEPWQFRRVTADLAILAYTEGWNPSRFVGGNASYKLGIGYAPILELAIARALPEPGQVLATPDGQWAVRECRADLIAWHLWRRATVGASRRRQAVSVAPTEQVLKRAREGRTL